MPQGLTVSDGFPWQLTVNNSKFQFPLHRMAQMADTPSCLCLGPKGSGKTHLLSSLQSPGSITTVSHSVPTIGTNIFRIKLNGSKSAASGKSGSNATCSKQKKVAAATSAARQSQFVKNTEIVVHEIGGAMAPMWTNYLGNVSKIIYVVDTSNLCQISAAGEFMYFNLKSSRFTISPPSMAGVLLYTLLADPRLQRTKMLLVLSKMDLAYRQMRNEALLILQYEKLKKQIRQPIDIAETSSITCSGHAKIWDWLSMP